jgi:hypothetical protein
MAIFKGAGSVADPFGCSIDGVRLDCILPHQTFDDRSD